MISIHTSPNFPSFNKSSRSFKYEAWVGIGGNVGDVKKRFEGLMRYWLAHPLLHVEQTSPIVQNPPFGVLEQPDFFNALAKIRTSLSPQRLLKILLHTEKCFGRVRTIPNGPRTLDLDLIFYENVWIRSIHLHLPHPEWRERLSVLVPLELMDRRNWR
jgi:2-amino-4-hydroxy-6-hydroxymethyldihydropteridine diphosphokinase